MVAAVLPFSNSFFFLLTLVLLLTCSLPFYIALVMRTCVPVSFFSSFFGFYCLELRCIRTHTFSMLIFECTVHYSHALLYDSIPSIEVKKKMFANFFRTRLLWVTITEKEALSRSDIQTWRKKYALLCVLHASYSADTLSKRLWRDTFAGLFSSIYHNLRIYKCILQ